MKKVLIVILVFLAILLGVYLVSKHLLPKPKTKPITKGIYRELIMDFSDPIIGNRTHLCGYIWHFYPEKYGKFIFKPNEGSSDYSPGMMGLEWNLPRNEKDAFGGIHMGLRGPEESLTTLDLSRWDNFSFKVQGEATIHKKPFLSTDDETVVMRVEILDKEIDEKQAAYVYLAVIPGDDWSTVQLDADIGNSNNWSFTGDPLNPKLAKKLQIKIESKHNTISNGIVHFDDFALTRKSTENDYGSKDDDEFLEEISRDEFRFFWDYGHPDFGWVPDQSAYSDTFEPEGMGFQLTIMPIAVERGWVTRKQAADRVRMILEPFASLPQGTQDRGIIGYKGSFYHFLGVDGMRKTDNGISNIANAIFILGGLTCRGYFDQPEEADIRNTVTNLFMDIDWSLTLRDDNFFSMEWGSQLNGETSKGLMPLHWDYYTDESQLLALMAIAGNYYKHKSEHIPEEVLWKWIRFEATTKKGVKFVPTPPGAIFAQTFTSLWFGKKVLDRPDLHPTMPINWWENTKKFIKASYEYCHENSDKFGDTAWGLSACMSRYKNKYQLYNAYGSPPRAIHKGNYEFIQADEPFDISYYDPELKKQVYVPQNSVLTPYGAALGINYWPEESIKALRFFREKTDLYRTADCGYGDAIDMEEGWIGRPTYCIDSGPMIIAIDNYRSAKEGKESVVYRSLLKSPEIRYALEKNYGAVTKDD